MDVRHRSWFQDLANNNMCLVWGQLAGLHTPPIVTSDFVYVRFIGDGSIQEKDFGHIQIDRKKEMKEVARTLNKDEGNLSNIKFSIVAANNHYSGFGPGTVNIFRHLLGLEEVKWGDEYVSEDKDDLPLDSANENVIKTNKTSLPEFL